MFHGQKDVTIDFDIDIDEENQEYGGRVDVTTGLSNDSFVVCF